MNNIKILFIAISLLFIFNTSSYANWAKDFHRSELTVKEAQGTITDQEKRILATYRGHRVDYSTVDKNGNNTPKTIRKTAIVEEIPKKSLVGGVALQRAKKFAAGGAVAVVGGAIVDSLIKSVGWVMEEGTYVKFKPVEEEQSPNIPYVYTIFNSQSIQSGQQYAGRYYASPASACNVDDMKTLLPHLAHHADNGVETKDNEMYCGYKIGTSYKAPIRYVQNLDYDPDAQNPEPQKIVITPEDVGGLLLGDYDDPVDPAYDDHTNEWKRPELLSTYQPDPTGLENQLSDQLDRRAEDADPTDDGKPAPFGDPRYPPLSNPDSDANDRSWEEDNVDDVNGESTPVLDPETGEPTGGQSIKLQFPVFCEWAYIVCDWYDKWKKTDEWLKEEPQLENEQLEIHEENILDYQHENHVSFGQSCPFSPNTTVIDFGISSFSFETDLTFICTWGNQARAYVITLGHLGALIFLLLGIRNGNV